MAETSGTPVRALRGQCNPVFERGATGAAIGAGGLLYESATAKFAVGVDLKRQVTCAQGLRFER